MATLGDRIRAVREKRNLSQRDLAKLAKVNHSLLSRVESGERASISLLTAKRIAEALQVSLDYLAGMYDESGKHAELVGA